LYILNAFGAHIFWEFFFAFVEICIFFFNHLHITRRPKYYINRCELTKIASSIRSELIKSFLIICPYFDSSFVKKKMRLSHHFFFVIWGAFWAAIDRRRPTGGPSNLLSKSLYYVEKMHILYIYIILRLSNHPKGSFPKNSREGTYINWELLNPLWF